MREAGLAELERAERSLVKHRPANSAEMLGILLPHASLHGQRGQLDSMERAIKIIQAQPDKDVFGLVRGSLPSLTLVPELRREPPVQPSAE